MFPYHNSVMPKAVSISRLVSHVLAIAHYAMNGDAIYTGR